ncbi:alkaline phosphatase [Jannaschia sp. LMIT008]|uniref:alkaline phosphatase n=1 Tax=Jannaschia maritima TaxID=3032585 RepID=UPI0028116784|nr:alkaline phosphatase [Jannaschia sp. LMIT008]
MTPIHLPRLGALTIAGVLALTAPSPAATARNVILMITDGASWGTFDMASYWEFGAKGRQPYDAFDVRLGMTTQRLTDPPVEYHPDAAWDATPTGTDSHFEGYRKIRQNATDSAAAATALATGQRTQNGRVSTGRDGTRLTTITEEMKQDGRAVGVVTSVGISHATPAAFGANSDSRHTYNTIASQMIHDGTLDLVMGAGHPDYDRNGKLNTSPDHKWISQSDWAALNGADAPMTLIDRRDQFEALADGTLQIEGRLIGVARAAGTLQADRRKGRANVDPDGPRQDRTSVTDGDHFIETVPTLSTMTRGALNHLSRDGDGLFVMIEGGAVDWMAHANRTDRIIEEQVAFNHAVRTAVDWVEAESSWDETLMVVLTDHGNGMPMGPDSATIAFQGIQNNGRGMLPGVAWHSGSHTSENTLLWAHGAGSEQLSARADGMDPYLMSRLGFNDGRYLDIVDVHPAIKAAAGLTGPSPIPLPASGWMLLAGIGGLSVGARRRAIEART